MRPPRHLLLASATLAAALLLCACGSGPAQAKTVPSTCGSVSAPHHATVVVTHGDGSTVQRCVGFSTPTISGATLMEKSGLEFATQTFSFGKAACEIDDQPRHWAKCLPSGGEYWALYTLKPGSSTWKTAQSGYATVKLSSGGALGWRYEPETQSPAPVPASPRK
ncbi:MAG: hypothetical protein ACREQM_08000 [Candidatus Dormibacteraceae bacterium]